jgi:PPOX class probable F420-dependent enzyme
MDAPKPHRPRMDKGYLIPDTPPQLEWGWVEEQLAKSRNYWITTVRKNGRAHAMPVWGLWMDGAVMFSTGRGSVKARNIARDAEMVVHLESGDEVVIIEGRAEVETDKQVLGRFVEAYEKKYDFRPDPNDGEGMYYRVRPRVVLAWTEKDFQNSAARWEFDG